MALRRCKGGDSREGGWEGLNDRGPPPPREGGRWRLYVPPRLLALRFLIDCGAQGGLLSPRLLATTKHISCVSETRTYRLSFPPRDPGASALWKCLTLILFLGTYTTSSHLSISVRRFEISDGHLSPYCEYCGTYGE